MTRNGSRRFDHNDANQLLAYLEYALRDVQLISDRSGRYLEQAINTLAEDTASDAAVDVGQN